MNNELAPPQVYTATVSDKVQLVGDFYLVRFALTTPATIAFRAGQYVTFHIGPPKLRHTLSIVSPPQSNNFIEVLQSVAPGGHGSRWALNLKAGDTVQFTGPLGKFTINKASKRKKVLVATGCGIAPIRSMILDFLAGRGSEPIALYWGLRRESDLFWQDELKKLAERYANFRYFMTLSQPENGWQGRRGRVTDHVLANEAKPEDADFYLCGSREMIADMKRLLTGRGVVESEIHTETFF